MNSAANIWSLASTPWTRSPGGYRLLVFPTDGVGWVGTVYQADVPVAIFGVADTAEAATPIWGGLVEIAAHWHIEVPDKLPELPWCAAVILASSPAVEWLGDFERCVARAWLER